MLYTLDFRDAGFEEVLEYINKISYVFADKIKELSYVSGNVEIQELLSEKSLNQFLAIIYSLNILIEAKLNNSRFQETVYIHLRKEMWGLGKNCLIL